MNFHASDPAQRIGATGNPTVILERAQSSACAQRNWEGLPAALISGDERLDYDKPYAVLGGPGTGKTSLLVDAALSFLLQGGRAEDMMFVAPSKAAAARIRAEIFERVSDVKEYAGTGAPVRSVHSWAFALYRAIRQSKQEPLPRLISGAEHDAQIRILLKGELEDGLSLWPDEIMPALGMVGFARQLRDLILRATERGVRADELQQLGVKHSRPMWEAAGNFLRRYEQTQRLGEVWNLNASELLHSVIEELEGDGSGVSAGEQLALRQRERLQLVLVDDAHNMDPASASFIETLIAPGTRVIIAGDPDQCVFHFRGADEAFLLRHSHDDAHLVVLSKSHRLNSDQAAAVQALTGQLPHLRTRIPVTECGGQGQLRLLTASSSMSEKLHVANVVRRAHLEDGVAWGDIAVIVRDTAQISSLRRVLMSHGVPVKVDPTSVVLAEQPLVSVLLLAMESTYRRLSTNEMRCLLESSVGGADPVMVRRVERSINRAITHERILNKDLPRHSDGAPYQAIDYLNALLAGEATEQEREAWTRFFGPREETVSGRLAKVLNAGREAYENGEGVETVLWRVWQATDLANHLQTRALRGGTLGAQADQDLDAVMSLFDLAGDFAERNPAASVETFVEEVRAQELPTGTRERSSAPTEAVEILPAHAAAGRQWEVVVVSGVQEDLWPAGPTVGGLFNQQELVDLLDRKIDPNLQISRIGPAVEEERRLFLLALSRAHGQCVITAVDNDSDEAGVPSRFLSEIEGAVVPFDATSATDELADKPPASGTEEPQSSSLEQHPHAEHDIPRVLALEPLLGELRYAVSESRSSEERENAARNLARMATAGIFGAHPSQWWGVAAPSTDEPMVDKDGKLRLSPSRLEALNNCALGDFFARHSGVGLETDVQRIGIAVHCIAQAIVDDLSSASAPDAQHLTLESVLDAVEVYFPQLVTGAAWSVEHNVKRWREGIEKLYRFISERVCGAGSNKAVAEKEFSVCLGQLHDGTEVVLNGRVDLAIINADGATMVYDFKTARTAKSAEAVAGSHQLSAYQFMVAHTEGLTNDGAALVYPGETGRSSSKGQIAEARDVQQMKLSAEELSEYKTKMLALAEAAQGPSFRATPGPHCTYCGFASACPAQTAGRMLV
ncbi:ATP-dependent DNA helicase [Corynebacterium anserum]|uniref:DNA 3'-5' helicase n=1 Tax=Corynebacterium anserum TaxID=2684406 RepID=A0A7G7YPM1_9CORY|nr:ATP-dependent DNA helicase [Corynebacterium anserum]MBC2682077.1 UvrD-helicase domain-containing protein [Corynebacterium anserum]QNH96441.1 AAA family ATPase [Corynebacterium anserum]